MKTKVGKSLDFGKVNGEKISVAKSKDRILWLIISLQIHACMVRERRKARLEKSLDFGKMKGEKISVAKSKGRILWLIISLQIHACMIRERRKARQNEEKCYKNGCLGQCIFYYNKMCYKT